MPFQDDFDIGLFEVGDYQSCLLSWFCGPCVIAHARSFLDKSDPFFSLFCINVPTLRWLAKSSYGIEGDPKKLDPVMDLLVPFFCPCCTLNQLYQTIQSRGSVVVDTGSEYHTRSWEPVNFNSEGVDVFGTFVYSYFCNPCSNGQAMQMSLGMPFVLGCCCVNSFTAHNLIRYQYRIKPYVQRDFFDECLLPCILVNLISASVQDDTSSFIIQLGLSAVATQTLLEAKKGSRRFGQSPRYLLPQGGLVAQPGVPYIPVPMRNDMVYQAEVELIQDGRGVEVMLTKEYGHTPVR